MARVSNEPRFTEITEGDEHLEELAIAMDSHLRFPDDGFTQTTIVQQTRHLLESITRIGGEVCKLRAEVDGLLENNAFLSESFRKLRTVITEKGHMDLDDFDLACEVLSQEQGSIVGNRKFSH